MGAMKDFLENKHIDWFFRAQALGVTGASAGAGSGPTTLYIGLLTAPATDSAAGTEVTGGSYARVAVTSALTAWAATQGGTGVSTGTTGTTSNLAAITFPAPTANWGVITDFAIYDAASGGNQLWEGALAAAKTVNNGDAAPVFPIGSLTVQIDN